MLRRSNPYIVVHELSHMIENELGLSIEQEFLHKVYQDIEQNLKRANILVQKIIGQVIFKEIQAYQTAKSRASELFARYFELFAWAQEVYPKDKEYLIRTRDLNKVFLATNQWEKSRLDPKIMDRIDKEIKEYSNKTVFKDVNKVQSSWTNKFLLEAKKFLDSSSQATYMTPYKCCLLTPSFLSFQCVTHNCTNIATWACQEGVIQVA